MDARAMLETCTARTSASSGQSDYRLVRHVEDSQEYRIVRSIMQVNPAGGRVNRLPHRSTPALGQDVIDGQYANWSTQVAHGGGLILGGATGRGGNDG